MTRILALSLFFWGIVDLFLQISQNGSNAINLYPLTAIAGGIFLILLEIAIRFGQQMKK